MGAALHCLVSCQLKALKRCAHEHYLYFECNHMRGGKRTCFFCLPYRWCWMGDQTQGKFARQLLEFARQLVLSSQQEVLTETDRPEHIQKIE